jgi:hypothetical protein
MLERIILNCIFKIVKMVQTFEQDLFEPGEGHVMNSQCLLDGRVCVIS